MISKTGSAEEENMEECLESWSFLEVSLLSLLVYHKE